MLVTTEKQVLNFVVTGQIRCGASVIQTSIQTHPKAVCHGDLLHTNESLRRAAHEAYFGVSESERIVEWCAPRLTDLSPEQYLTSRIFDHPRYDEQVVGTRLLYPHLQAFDMWDFCRAQCLRGDFCLIHVTRNPLACYISMKQAEQTGVYQQRIDDRTIVETPQPVNVDIGELTAFCREHAAQERKIREHCDDRLEIEYRDLIVDYNRVIATVFDYLDLPAFPKACPGVRRLKNRSIPDRLFDFHDARAKVPADVREFFDADDLF